VFVVLAILNYRPSIERIHCNEEILDSQPEVIMLSTWWCSYCYQARRYLTNNNISYCEYDIERSAEGEKLFNDLNAQAIPVLLVDKYIINGFDEARLESLLSRVREES
jgi:glutaredoxin